MKDFETKGYVWVPWFLAELGTVQTTDPSCLDSVANNSDLRIMLLVGETMPRVFEQETTMLENFRTSGLLDEFYAHGFGAMQPTLWLGSVVRQITDRHQHLRLLEIGDSAQSRPGCLI